MNNTTSNETECVFYEPFVTIQKNAVYFAYSILPYPYFVFGILGHSRMLYACYKQSKTESGYLLQTFFSIVRILEIICFMMLIFGFNRWASRIYGVHWYRSNFALMWFATHLIIPLVNGFINTSMLMTLCISLDRALSLWKPEAYRKKWYRTRYRVGAFVLCLFVGFAVVTYDAGRMYVSYDHVIGEYDMQNDNVYQGSAAGVVFTALRDIVDFGGVAALIVANGAVIRLYRIRMIKPVVANTAGEFGQSLSVADVEKEARRKEAERTLLLLSVCQSIVATLSMGFMMLMYMLQYTLNALYCLEILDIGWPVCDAGLQLAALLDFYAPLAISKSLRRIVFSDCAKKKVVVSPIGTSQPQQQEQRGGSGRANERYQ